MLGLCHMCALYSVAFIIDACVMRNHWILSSWLITMPKPVWRNILVPTLNVKYTLEKTLKLPNLWSWIFGKDLCK